MLYKYKFYIVDTQFVSLLKKNGRIKVSLCASTFYGTSQTK